MIQMGRPSTKAEIFDTLTHQAKSRRDKSLEKVEPKLQGIPGALPLNSQQIPQTVLTEKERDITENYSVTELLESLKAKKLSVEEVTRAFLRRAAVAHAAVSDQSERRHEQQD